MATYQRQTGTIPKTNNPQTTTEVKQSQDISSIIIKSFETATKDLNDNDAIPVKITEDNRDDNYDNLLKNKTKSPITKEDLNDLLKDKTKSNARKSSATVSSSKKTDSSKKEENAKKDDNLARLLKDVSKTAIVSKSVNTGTNHAKARYNNTSNNSPNTNNLLMRQKNEQNRNAVRNNAKSNNSSGTNNLLMRQKNEQDKDADKERKKVDPFKPLMAAVHSGTTNIAKGVQENTKHLKDIRDLTLLQLIGKLLPAATVVTAGAAVLPGAVAKTTDFLISWPVKWEGFQNWLKLTLTGPDNVFVKFGRILRKGVNDIGAKMSKSDNAIISGLGKAIFGASGGGKRAHLTVEMEKQLTDNNPEMMRFINHLESTGVQMRDKNGNLDFDVDELREAYENYEKENFAPIQSNKKKFGKYYREDVMGNTAVQDYLEKYGIAEDSYGASIAVDSGLSLIQDKITKAGNYAKDEKQLKESYSRLIYDMVDKRDERGNKIHYGEITKEDLAKADNEFLDLFMKDGKFDLESATEAMAVYSGAQQGKQAKASFDKQLKKGLQTYDDVINLGEALGAVKEESYDPNKDKAKLEPKVKEAQFQQLMGDLYEHGKLGDWTAEQWKIWEKDVDKRYGEGMGGAARIEFESRGNRINTKDNGALEKLNAKAHARWEENKQAISNVVNTIVGVTNSQSTSAVSNMGN